MSRVGAIHPDLPAGAVLVVDRGFCSYADLVLCQWRKPDQQRAKPVQNNLSRRCSRGRLTERRRTASY